jgi:hypothetical protein
MSTLNGGPGNIVTNGLVLYLDAANYLSYTSGSTTWRDLSSSNTSGSLVNGPTFSSGNAGSIVFDGVDDYVSTNYSGGTFSTLTLCAWIYKTNTTRAYILNSANPYGFGFELYETTMYFNVQGSGSRGYGEFDFNNTGWNYWVMVYEGAATGNSNKLKAYRNGVQEILTYFNTVPVSFISTGNFVLGQRPWFTSYSQCTISSTQIYNRALSAQEILQNYNATKGRFGL